MEKACLQYKSGPLLEKSRAGRTIESSQEGLDVDHQTLCCDQVRAEAKPWGRSDR